MKTDYPAMLLRIRAELGLSQKSYPNFRCFFLIG